MLSKVHTFLASAIVILESVRKVLILIDGAVLAFSGDDSPHFIA